MSIQRVYQSGWSVGEKVTPHQQNALDLNSVHGIDKRAGQNDYFGSQLIATGAGRVIKTVQTGPDANVTFHVQDGCSIVRIPTMTSARTYTLGHSGATGGDRISFYLEGTGPTGYAGATGYVGSQMSTGYVDILNGQGTGLFRLGVTKSTYPIQTAEGDSAEFIFTDGSWKLMYGAGPGMRHVDFTASTTWVCPPGVYEILLIGYGGGGGGGTGGFLSNSGIYSGLESKRSGGGGGGGSQLRVQRISVIPGRTYTITVGDGGQSDSDGNDTIFADSGLATNLAVFPGAARGGPGGVLTMINVGVATSGVTGSAIGVAFGGAGVRAIYTTMTGVPTGQVVGQPTMIRIDGGYDSAPFRGPTDPGAGGPGATSNAPISMLRQGWYSSEGFPGGTAGPHALYKDVNQGGGGGGGGGGPAGIGGCGGTGGDFIIVGLPARDGCRGGTGAANSGAGGGGGGAGGYDNDVGGASPGPGGQGGSGKLTAVII